MHTTDLQAIHDQITHIRSQVKQLHTTVDRERDTLRDLLGPQADATLRAEEAGAALHRLEWCLERLETPRPQRARSGSTGVASGV